MAIKNGTSWQAKSDPLENNGKTISSPFFSMLESP
jgi:hypothetical protein